jgi:hypothetical protein
MTAAYGIMTVAYWSIAAAYRSMTVAYKMKVIGGGLKVEGCVPPNVCLLFYNNSNNGLHPYSLRSLSDTSNYDHHFV